MATAKGENYYCNDNDIIDLSGQKAPALLLGASNNLIHMRLANIVLKKREIIIRTV
jgi:hypothetical protein